MMSQLHDIVQPFAASAVKQLPATAKRPALDFVSWTDKIQRLIQILPDYSWEIVGLHRSGDESEQVAVHGRLKVTVDGTPRVIDGIGQGENAKNASTDAFSRACAFLGVGLHLWCQGGIKDAGYWITGVIKDESADE